MKRGRRYGGDGKELLKTGRDFRLEEERIATDKMGDVGEDGGNGEMEEVEGIRGDYIKF